MLFTCFAYFIYFYSPLLAPQEALEVATVPLTPIQHFFFQTFDLKNWNHFNQVYNLNLSKNKLSTEQWTTLAMSLATHHDMLRATYTCTGPNKNNNDSTCWVQSVPSTVSDPSSLFAFVDLSEVSEEHKMVEFEKEMNKHQQSFDITQGTTVPLVIFF